MEDEMDQEGIEEESSSGKEKPKGGLLKNVIIGAVLLVVAVVVVFGFILPTFFGEPPSQDEGEQKTVAHVGELTEYGVEFKVEPITVSMKENRAGRTRVRNFIVDVTFETSDKGVIELSRRPGQIHNIIQREIERFEADMVIEPATKDSLQVRIQRQVNLRLPLDEKDKIRNTYISIITQ